MSRILVVRVTNYNQDTGTTTFHTEVPTDSDIIQAYNRLIRRHDEEHSKGNGPWIATKKDVELDIEYDPPMPDFPEHYSGDN
jgi:hypothetical protein